MNASVDIYLQPTEIIDAHHSSIKNYAQKLLKRTAKDPVERAVSLYYGVRDGIWYDPYYPFYLPEHYRASNVLKNKRGYCVCKASLLCALGRAVGIPSRVGFATVRNHLATGELIKYIGSDLFVYHGYTEFFLEGKWVKATPAFNIELCRKHHVEPLEFNGREDSIFHAYNLEDKQFMEYIDDHGVYADIPVQTIVAAWEKAYGKSRVRGWIRRFESQENLNRDFYQETVVK
jgi:transglutaminase-like putative cysteine protease